MQIQIRNYQFTLDEPFAPGQTLGPGEARALNALRAERIRESITRRVIEAHGPTGQGVQSRLLEPETLANLQLQVDELAAKFKFPAEPRNRKPASTIEEEARVIARQRVEAECRRTGLVLSEEAIAELVTKAMGEAPVQQEARRRIETRQAVAAAALRELF